LYSDFDAAIGHYRRYGKAELINKLKSANFTIEKCEYADFIGFFAWLTTKNKKYDRNNQSSNEGQLKFYDQFIFPLSGALDKFGMKYVFGKNLLAIARKPIH
jgi:hypothetical protein